MTGWIAGILLLIAYWIRIAFPSLIVYIISQGIGGFGQGFIISVPSKLAIVWFSKTEIAKATTITALSVPLGAIVGMVLPALTMDVSSRLDPIPDPVPDDL